MTSMSSTTPTLAEPYKTLASDREEPDPYAGLARLDITKLTVKLTDAPKPLPDLNVVKFGTAFTDHMAIVSFHPASGWSAPEIRPYGPFTLDPASSCFQYSPNVFEGMKAYLGPDGKARLFRPELNMRRLERSMARMALPPIDGDTVLELLKRFVQTDKRWIPTLPGHSLYLRPTVIGTRAALGVAPSDHATLYIIACPCGPYFQRPVSLLAATHVVRAWPGGTGCDKVSGNYSPGFLPLREAIAQGYDQVMWLFGDDRRVTEAGIMNVFVVVKRADGDGLDVITPPLDGTILPGVTRASCLGLVSDPAFQASIVEDTAVTKLHAVERTFTMHDIVRWSKEDVLLELLCVGTAAIVTAVNRVGFEGQDIYPPAHLSDENGLGPIGRALRAKILAVQEGREEYHEWGFACE